MRSGGLLVLLCVVACHLPTKRNPGVCCTTQADCDAVGLPVGSDCADGEQCIGNACVVPTTCQAMSDCMEPTPICDTASGTCVQCLDATACSGALPACGPDHTCVECVDNSTCGGRICDLTTNSCRGCTDDSECPGGFCAPATMTCQRSIVPAFVPNACDNAATSDLTVAVDTIIDTSNATNCNGGLVAQAGAREICVVHHGNVSIQSGVTLTFTGSRPVALVADDTLSVDGVIEVGATGTVDGPGGGVTTSGGNESANDGGGGAGFATAGAPGGSQTVDGGGVNGGAIGTDPSSTSVLVGGSRASDATAGGGGGALSVISCRGTVTISGTIASGGGGGLGGPVGATAAGFGGGSGGYVALEGRMIVLTGQLFANGGGGGSGAHDNGTAGVAGSDGLRATAAAPGGGAIVGVGGAGGFAAVAPTAGLKKGTVQKQGVLITTGPGGGGGSVGFLHTYTPMGVTPTLTPSMVSPALQSNLSVETR